MLSLSICYHARLQKRRVYENGVAKHFTGPVRLPGSSQQFRDEIRWYVYTLLIVVHETIGPGCMYVMQDVINIISSQNNLLWLSTHLDTHLVTEYTHQSVPG